MSTRGSNDHSTAVPSIAASTSSTSSSYHHATASSPSPPIHPYSAHSGSNTRVDMHHHHFAQHSFSAEDVQFALALQRQEEEHANELAIRQALTAQFAKVSKKKIAEVDLSQLTLAEIQQAIEIQMQIKKEKKRGFLSRLMGKRKSSSGTRASSSLLLPNASAASTSSPRTPPLPPSSPLQHDNNSLHDQDFDVDNMDFAELLALSERIGNVSKGLSPEEIDRLPRVTYRSPAPSPAPSPKSTASSQSLHAALDSSSTIAQLKAGSTASHAKHARQQSSSSNFCLFCTANFADGDILLYLPCLHRAHYQEMSHWLSLSNQCPVCKHVVALH